MAAKAFPSLVLDAPRSSESPVGSISLFYLLFAFGCQWTWSRKDSLKLTNTAVHSQDVGCLLSDAAYGRPESESLCQTGCSCLWGLMPHSAAVTYVFRGRGQAFPPHSKHGCGASNLLTKPSVILILSSGLMQGKKSPHRILDPWLPGLLS